MSQAAAQLLKTAAQNRKKKRKKNSKFNEKKCTRIASSPLSTAYTLIKSCSYVTTNNLSVNLIIIVITTIALIGWVEHTGWYHGQNLKIHLNYFLKITNIPSLD
jgi:hypothetical protein